jgi:hypothetical protein
MPGRERPAPDVEGPDAPRNRRIDSPDRISFVGIPSDRTWRAIPCFFTAVYVLMIVVDVLFVWEAVA